LGILPVLAVNSASPSKDDTSAEKDKLGGCGPIEQGCGSFATPNSSGRQRWGKNAVGMAIASFTNPKTV